MNTKLKIVLYISFIISLIITAYSIYQLSTFDVYNFDENIHKIFAYICIIIGNILYLCTILFYLK